METGKKQEPQSAPSTLWVQLRMLAVQVVHGGDPENWGGGMGVVSASDLQSLSIHNFPQGHVREGDLQADITRL